MDTLNNVMKVVFGLALAGLLIAKGCTATPSKGKPRRT
jgi:hypothetical protein